MTKPTKEQDPIALLGEFIAEGIIEEAEEDRWRLTAYGKAVTEKIYEKLTHKEWALMLLYSDAVIRGFGK